MTARFSLVPASFFGMVLGLAGLANLWRVAHALWGVPAGIGEALFLLAAAVWGVVAFLYTVKWVAKPDLARAEAAHPVQCCFIGLAGVTTLLIAQGALPYSRAVAIVLFVLGASYTMLFGLWRTGLLWRGMREPSATTPVLYLPTVAGGFVAGTTAAALGWPDWGQLAFGAALFSWLAIESVLLHRLYTAESLPPAMRPTLGIQLAPPAVGAVSYLAVGGSASDLLGHGLIGYALLQALLLLRMARWIAAAPFAASYWAFSFGAMALATAVAKIVLAAPTPAFVMLAPILFAGANLLVACLAVGTIWLLFTHRLLPNASAVTSVSVSPGTARRT